MSDGESGFAASAAPLDIENRQWLYRMLLLFPGFLSIGIARYVGDLGEFGEFELTAYSLALSLSIFLLASLVYSAALKLRSLVFRHRGDRFRLIPSLASGLGFGITVLALSLCVAGLLANWYEDDTVHSLARRIPGFGAIANAKPTSKRPLRYFLSTNEAATLQEEFSCIPTCAHFSWAEIAVDGGGHFGGYPRLYSDEKQRAEIFLMPACTTETNHVRPIEGPGVLIPEDKIQSITFYDETPCSQIWKKLNRRSNCPYSDPKKEVQCLAILKSNSPISVGAPTLRPAVKKAP